MKFKDIDKIKVAISETLLMKGNIIGYQFGAKFKLVLCAKYDRGLDLGFWEILKLLKWIKITSFFLIKTNGSKDPLNFL